MEFQYICGKEVMASVPIAPAPVLQLARMGVLIDYINQGARNVTQSVAGDYQQLQSLDVIKTVVYPGILDQPDSLPVDDYNQLNFSVVCKWARNGQTGGFLLLSVMDAIEPITQGLYDLEKKMNKTVKSQPDDSNDTALYPFFYSSAELGKGILDALAQQNTQQANTNFASLATYAQVFKARSAYVQQHMQHDDDMTDYYSILMDASECLDQMTDDLKGLA